MNRGINKIKKNINDIIYFIWLQLINDRWIDREIFETILDSRIK